MASDQPPIAPTTSSKDPLHSPQPASIDNPALQARRSDERLLDPSAPSQGASMFPEMFQGNSLPEIGALSTPIGVHSYSSNIPNIPHTNMHYRQLPLGTPSQLIQLQPWGVLQHPYVGQPQTIHPYPATGIPFHDWSQSGFLPQNSLGPHPQVQDLIGLPPFDSFAHASSSSGPPPEAATASIHRESVDELGPQGTSLPPK